MQMMVIIFWKISRTSSDDKYSSNTNSILNVYTISEINYYDILVDTLFVVCYFDYTTITTKNKFIWHCFE